MHPIELVIGLILAAVVLATVAQYLRLPHPTALVSGGVALGFVPGPERFLASVLADRMREQARIGAIDRQAAGEWVCCSSQPLILSNGSGSMQL